MDLSGLCDIPNKNQIRCLCTLTVIEALELLETNPSIDLVLASVSMPIRSGMDILQHVKQDRRL
jgi:CheY-like chemotaxis protein